MNLPVAGGLEEIAKPHGEMIRESNERADRQVQQPELDFLQMLLLNPEIFRESCLGEAQSGAKLSNPAAHITDHKVGITAPHSVDMNRHREVQKTSS